MEEGPLGKVLPPNPSLTLTPTLTPTLTLTLTLALTLTLTLTLTLPPRFNFKSSKLVRGVMGLMCLTLALTLIGP